MKVGLLPVGDVPRGFLSGLSSRLARLGVLAHILPEVSMERSEQSLSRPLRAEALVRIAADHGPSVLAVTAGDLRADGYEFVFGYANVGSPGAVVSIARLQDGDAERSIGRLVKEAVHELGHTWGLVHCDMPMCVMDHSVTVPDVDAKRERLCDDCRRRVPFGTGKA